jgi:hypothetical protein
MLTTVVMNVLKLSVVILSDAMVIIVILVCFAQHQNAECHYI